MRSRAIAGGDESGRDAASVTQFACVTAVTVSIAGRAPGGWRVRIGPRPRSLYARHAPTPHAFALALLLPSTTMPVAPAASPAPRPPHSPYGYVPTEWIAILFVVLFSLSGSARTRSTSHGPVR